MKAVRTLGFVVALLSLVSCSSFNDGLERWRNAHIGGASPDATDTGARHMKSSEGALETTNGKIEPKKGYFYLFSSDGHQWDLNDQTTAKRFGNKSVSVWGYFDYNKHMIDVQKIYPAPPEGGWKPALPGSQQQK